MKGEEDMAAKKAALLEKRLRREREAQERKQQQELDQEQKKEAARSDSFTYCAFVTFTAVPRFNPIQNLDFFFLSFRLKAEAEQQKKDEEKARREYIRNEYLRKKQLKLMVDMDEVIKPRSGSLKKKPRPKSIHRDVMEPPTPLVKATGEQHAVASRDTHSRQQQPLIHDLSCRCPAGVRPRGFSVSSVSLASLNLADNDQRNNRKSNR